MLHVADVTSTNVAIVLW